MPCASPEYTLVVPNALEYWLECLAMTKLQARVPTSDPETVDDIKLASKPSPDQTHCPQEGGCREVNEGEDLQ
ncbi:hypothetical protein G4B88_008548 [Cannabis sativa]|uniref:Uncharacterized protein n=1 Tax=Cannabis sativa TaxID=3483 RepID=A0A7J6FB10_CANSA|nr:hypothetical protein G4B88_008548 [Cannabis sativa]